MILYTSIAITSVYVVIGIVCIIGAIKKSPELLLPWLFVDVLVMTIFLAFLWGGDQNENFVDIFGGHWVYRKCTIWPFQNIKTKLALSSIFIWINIINTNFTYLFTGIGCLILTVMNIHMWLTVRCYYRALKKQIENKEMSCRTTDSILPIKSSASNKNLNHKFTNVIWKHNNYNSICFPNYYSYGSYYL